jgi:hypothetical protein
MGVSPSQKSHPRTRGNITETYHILNDNLLVLVLLLAIPMARIDHDPTLNASLASFLNDGQHVLFRVVGTRV